MRDGPVIAAGLAAFVALALAPAWQRAWAPAAERPAPEVTRRDRPCVAPPEVMRASHMQRLAAWREAVVRDAGRVERTAGGREVTRSLDGGCLECHANRREFCDRCHGDLGVKPACWSCHDGRERS